MMSDERHNAAYDRHMFAEPQHVEPELSREAEADNEEHRMRQSPDRIATLLADDWLNLSRMVALHANHDPIAAGAAFDTFVKREAKEYVSR